MKTSRIEYRWIWLLIIFAMNVLGQAPAWAAAENQDIELIRAAVKLREEKPNLFAGSHGLVVLGVLPGSEAESAGLQRGDIIIKYGGGAINSMERFAERIANAPAATMVKLAYLRDERRQVTVINGGIDSIFSINGEYLVKTAVENPLLQDVQYGSQAAWQKGEKEFRRFVQKNKHRIDNRIFLNKALYASSNHKEAALRQALIAAEEMGDEETTADVSHRYGRYYARYLRDPEQAIKHFRKALAGYGEIDDSQGQGEVYLSLGKLFSGIGKTSEALEYCQKALAFYVKAGTPSDQNIVYRVMGDILRLSGNYPEALASCQKALPYYQKTDNLVGQACIYEDIALIQICTGDYTYALKNFRTALHFYRKGNNPLIQGNEERILMHMGHIFYTIGNYVEALKCYQKALPAFKRGNNLLRQGDACLSIGEVHYRTGKNTEALENYDHAHSLYVRSNSIEFQAYALFGKAKVLAKMGKEDQAAHLYDEALALLEQVRRRGDRDEFKSGFIEKVTENYETAILFMIQNGYRERALRYAESMKARLFLDQMNEGRVELPKGIDPDLKQRRDSLERELAKLKSQLQEAIRARKAPKEAALRKAGHEKAAELEGLKQTIRLQNPLYAQVQYPQPVNLTTLQKKVLHPGEVLLEYLVAKNGVYCFVVGQDTYEIVQLPIDSPTLKKEVEALVKHLHTEPDFGVNRVAGAAMNKCSRKLYQALLKPLDQHTKGKTLIVVPDGLLAKLPFEALRTDDGDDIERHSISYVQSASVLEILRTHDQQQSPGGFIGFGDLVYDYENFKAGKSELNGKARTKTLSQPPKKTVFSPSARS